MFYSMFDAKRGTYSVYQDSLERPVNADLPVPDLPPDVNSIGVPASESGRPLPREARFVGRSWTARGMIVTPANSGLGEYSEQGHWFMALIPLALIVGSIAIVCFYDNKGTAH